MRSFYCLLGCDKACSSDELKKAYFEKLRQVHPDKNEGLDDGEFLLTHSAWAILGKPATRRAYDAWLEEQRLRETKECIWDEIRLEPTEEDAGAFEFECRCGGGYVIEASDVQRILDFAFFECSNCSLCLKVHKAL